MFTPRVDDPSRSLLWRASLVLLATLLAHALVLQRVNRMLLVASTGPDEVATVHARLLQPPAPEAAPPAPPPPKPRPPKMVRPKPPPPVPAPAAEPAQAPGPVDGWPAIPDAPLAAQEAPADAAVAPPEPEAPEAAAEPVPFEATGEVLMFALAKLPEMRAAMPAAARYVYRTTNSEIRIATGTTVVDWTLADDGRYELRLTTTAVGITVLELLSQGNLGDFGLAPKRYTETRARRAAEAANFDWDSRRITFSARADEQPLADGTQDRVSFQIQLMLLGQAQPELFRPGAQLVMWMAGRGDLADYRFRAAGHESTATGIGVLDAVRLERIVSRERDARIDVWVVPQLGWLPVRLRFTDRLGRVTESVLESIPKS
jgi:hypothetical protein